MKKAKLLGVLLCSASLAVSGVTPVMADSVSVVTLGADLSAEQKNMMMRYFKADSSQVQILTITNQDEREHLSAYVPIEQIGTRTVSCAYVKPTQSGGIKVRTANLNWVTCNMIATTLSTSGVKNCEVVAACPFEVSGTGALTGIQMAYETATGEKLDETKKQIATEEMVVTGTLADEVGKNNATTVINKSKMEVIQNDVQNAGEITNVVTNIAQQNNVTLSQEQLDKIVDLLEEIAQQDYDYDDVKDTLEMVDANVSDESSEIGEVDEETDDTVDAGEIVYDEDSIVDGLDDSILGEDIVASSTEDPALEVQTGMDADAQEEYYEETLEADMPEETYSEETYNEEAYDEGTYNEGTSGSETSDGNLLTEDTSEWETYDDEAPYEEYTQENSYEETDADAAADTQFDTSVLTEEQTSMFDKIKTFCQGEYEGDMVALQTVLEDEAVWAAAVMDPETGRKTGDKVERICYDIFVQGTDSYVADGMETYMNVELNMIDKALQAFFGLDDAEQADEILVNVSEEDRAVFYRETMQFFEKIYGEEPYENDMEETYEEENGSYEEDGSYEEEIYEEEDGSYEEDDSYEE